VFDCGLFPFLAPCADARRQTPMPARPALRAYPMEKGRVLRSCRRASNRGAQDPQILPARIQWRRAGSSGPAGAYPIEEGRVLRSCRRVSNGGAQDPQILPARIQSRSAGSSDPAGAYPMEERRVLRSCRRDSRIRRANSASHQRCRALTSLISAEQTLSQVPDTSPKRFSERTSWSVWLGTVLEPAARIV